MVQTTCFVPFYCMSKKSWPNLYIELLYKMGQDCMVYGHFVLIFSLNLPRTHCVSPLWNKPLPLLPTVDTPPLVLVLLPAMDYEHFVLVFIIAQNQIRQIILEDRAETPPSDCIACLWSRQN